MEEHRPWGYYVIFSKEINHEVKKIVVYPGKRLSLQRHQHRAENWVIIEGEGLFILNNTKQNVSAGDSVSIPIKSIHRIENIGENNLVFIEVQTGDYFGEDDIERFEDDYGRL